VVSGSRNKDGGHTNGGHPHAIQSAKSENKCAHADFMALFFIEPEVLRMEVSHGGNRDLDHFCSCDLDLYPMTFIYERDPYCLDVYRICKT